MADRTVVARLRGVHRRFGATVALAGVDLEVRRGELLALLGPNGAGKTTALGVLLGLRHPDEGTAELFGRSPADPDARLGVGSTPQESGFPDNLRVTEVVDLVRAHFPDPLPTGKVLDRFGLREVARRQTGGLSGGQKRRLSVAVAFAGNPRLVILDEPTTGLDVESRRGMWAAVRDYRAGGGTVLLTTHYLEEAEALADRVVVVDRGRVTAEGSVAEITARVSLTHVRVRAPELPELPGVVRSSAGDGRHELFTRDADELVRALVRSGAPFSGLQVTPMSLEDAFVALTGDSRADGGEQPGGGTSTGSGMSAGPGTSAVPGRSAGPGMSAVPGRSAGPGMSAGPGEPAGEVPAGSGEGRSRD